MSRTRLRDRRPWRRLAIATAFALAVVSCGGDDDGAAPEPTPGVSPAAAPTPRSVIQEPVFLRSEDGVVDLEVPAGAAFADMELMVEEIDPATMTGLDDLTVIAAYRLSPTGLRFPEPIPIVLRLPAEQDSSSLRLPLLRAMVRSGDSLAQPGEQTTFVDGETQLLHLTTIESFGTILIVDDGLAVELQPRRATQAGPGNSFIVEMTLTSEPTLDLDGEILVRWTRSGALGTGTSDEVPVPELAAGASTVVEQEFTCEVIGAAVYRLEVSVTTGSDDDFTRQLLTLEGESACGDVGRD